jgi:cytochrome c
MNTSMITRHRPAVSRRILPLIALTAGVVMIFAAFGAIRQASAQGQRTVSDGVYTAEQAQRGEKLFTGFGRCYVCHLRTLEGDKQQMATPLAGPFLTVWNGRTLDDLAYKIRYTMPVGIRRAGTLTVEETSDLIAYILQQNKMPAGSQELGTDSSQLKQITIKRP